MRKTLIIAIIFTASLAALMPLGVGKKYLPRPCQAQHYPPPPSWGPPGWTPAPPGSRAPVRFRDVEDRVWRLTNAIRRQYGVPPLSQDGRLSALAWAHSEDMLFRRFFSHINPEGLAAKDRVLPFYPGPVYRLGENIWMGSNFSTANSEALARSIINTWMTSPGHRENLLALDFTHLGVGVAAVGGEVRVTQIFVSLRPR